MPLKGRRGSAPHERRLLSSAARKNRIKSPRKARGASRGVEGCGHSDANFVSSARRKKVRKQDPVFCYDQFRHTPCCFGRRQLLTTFDKRGRWKNRPFKGGIIFNYHNIQLSVKKKINILCLFDFNMCRKFNFTLSRLCLPIKTAF
jgi:hypothetical protein